MLGETAAGNVERIGRDEQQAVGAREGSGERFRPIEIGGADLGALGGEVGQLRGIARGADHLAGARFEQRFDDEAAEMAAGAGDEECRFAHVSLFLMSGAGSRQPTGAVPVTVRN